MPTADCTDVRLEDVKMHSDSPLKKSSKRRFESGTTSIPGKISAILFPAIET